MKKSEKLLIIILILGGLFMISKTIYNKNYEKQIIQEINQVNEQNIGLIDSLVATNTLLEEYYCATENLLDSIFVHFTWQDVMDPYEYYEAVDNIYYQEYLYKYLENKRKQVYE